MEKEAKPMKETFSEIQRLRDELKLKSHLLKMETQKEFNKLESRWTKLQQEIKPARHAVEESGSQISAASKLLAKEIKDGYRRIKDSIAA